MACDLTLTGRGVGCKDALGGIKNIYIGEYEADIFLDIVAGEVAGLTGANTLNLKTYDLVRGNGSFTQTVTADIVAGTIFYEQSVSVTFHKLAAADVTELQNIMKGRMYVFVRDNNDNFFVLGLTNGVELTGGTTQTGTALGDQNGFTLELSAQEVNPAPFLDVTDNAPTDTDITFTAAP